MNSNFIYTKSSPYKWIFWFLLCCLAFQKLFILTQFHFKYFDNDQLIYWTMVKDYSQGIIHEPFFYGQDYNFPLEAWAAVPGYWLGLPPHILLPIVTLFFATFPFLMILYSLYKNEQYASAVLVLLGLCTLSLKYDLMTGIPRGFVQGLFLASLALPLLNRINYLI